MMFSEFAQKLYPLIGGGNSHHVFARSLFESIISEDGLAIIDEYGEDSFKAYYKGTTKITKLAQKIMPYADQFYFVDFMSNFGDAPIESLCEAFENDIPNIDPNNVPEKLAEFFYSILKEAAATKRNQGTLNHDNFDDETNEDEEFSEDSEDSKKKAIIHQQTNVVQNGETNMNLTNNGTINFNLKGDF